MIKFTYPHSNLVSLILLPGDNNSTLGRILRVDLYVSMYLYHWVHVQMYYIM